jgi:hypothetical protein
MIKNKHGQHEKNLKKHKQKKSQIKKRVPKGTSEYQAAWILSDDEDDKNSYTEQNVCLLQSSSLF